jgi:UDP-N-acetylmuramate dehydrogenase
MTYRSTNIPWTSVVAEVELLLTRDEPDAIKARVRDMQARRSESQPRAARSFGSVFQNPGGVDAHPQSDHGDGISPEALAEDGSLLGAGALIERAGLKGHRIGGARISPRHGNFIENDEHASTSDICALIGLARRQVREQFGVSLHTEVHLLDVDGFRSLNDVSGRDDDAT